MVELCKKHDINLLCYGTLAGGFLAGKYLEKPDPTGDFENRSLVKYKLIIDEYGSWDDFQSLLEAVDRVAKRHSVPMAAAAARYILDKPQVAAAIIGAKEARHVGDNQDICAFRLDDEDTALLDDAFRRSSGPAGDTFGLERIKGGPHEIIMKTDLNKLDT